MDIDNKKASVAIEISHTDAGIRALFFEQFREFKFLLEQTMEEKWVWDNNYFNELGQPRARIYMELKEKSIFDETNWQDLFTFFKQRIIAFDEFWGDAQDIFKDLAS